VSVDGGAAFVRFSKLWNREASSGADVFEGDAGSHWAPCSGGVGFALWAIAVASTYGIACAMLRGRYEYRCVPHEYEVNAAWRQSRGISTSKLRALWNGRHYKSSIAQCPLITDRTEVSWYSWRALLINSERRRACGGVTKPK
jgi:hypothetical protein